MNKTVTVNVSQKSLTIPPYCLGDGSAYYEDFGCEEELSEKVLEAWDGTDKPFAVKCDCGREYEFVLKVELDVMKRDYKPRRRF